MPNNSIESEKNKFGNFEKLLKINSKLISLEKLLMRNSGIIKEEV